MANRPTNGARLSHTTGVVLLNYARPVLAQTGRAYAARACGAPARDGTRRWHGWLEFMAGDEITLRTPRETTQSNRAATLYWATGVTPIYLEGALRRAHALWPVSASAGHCADARLDLTAFDRRFLQWLGISHNQS